MREGRGRKGKMEGRRESERGNEKNGKIGR